MRNYHFVYFTCKRDVNLLTASVKLLKTLYPEVHVHLVVDGYNMFNTRDKASFNGMVDTIRTTTYNRRGNLLGKANHIGQFGVLADIAAEYPDADAIVKVDSDTFVLKLDWLDMFEDYTEANLIGGFTDDDPYYPQGCCYALRPSFISRIAKDMVRFPSWYAAWEDYEVGYRLARLSDNPEESMVRYKWRLDFLSEPPLNLDDEGTIASLRNAQIYAIDVHNYPQFADINTRFMYMCDFVRRWPSLKDAPAQEPTNHVLEE